MYRSFRYNFHGAVCLFSKYFQHLLKGENLYELDLDNYLINENNAFFPEKNLSSNWHGTCKLIELFNYFRTNYSNYFNSLNSTINSCSSNSICHKNTINYYEITKRKIKELEEIYTLSSKRPSGATSSLTPYFEKEFRDLSNLNTLGGLIYDNFMRLENNIDKINDIQDSINNYLSDINIQTNLNNAYLSMINFDKTITSASNIMITNFLNDKKMILNFFNFMFLFINSTYLIVWLCLLICLIEFECTKYKCFYYFTISFINLLLLLSIWEIVLSFLFQGIRLFCRQSPKAMEFIFTGNYIINGNTQSYSPKFGNKDPIQLELFTTCLNGNGNLFQNFLSKSSLDSILSQTEYINIKSTNFSNILKDEINKSNMKINQYEIYNNYSYIYSSILKLEEMQKNLYLVSEGFGDDDIRNIVNNIRNNLENYYCGMTYEYYVIKKEDCPKYSIILDKITNSVDNINHCYIIQDLSDNSKASYSGPACNNSYINNAILFIKEVDNLLKKRINLLKDIQENYMLSWNNMYSEIAVINNKLNNIQNLIEDEINNNYQMGNCSSVRFDLIDFSDFIYKKIGYKTKIMIIFSSLIGILGMFLFYGVLFIIKQIENENFYNENYYGDFLINNKSKTNQFKKARNIKNPKFLKNDDAPNPKFYYKDENKMNVKDKSNDYLDINNNNDSKIKIKKIEMKKLK